MSSSAPRPRKLKKRPSQVEEHEDEEQSLALQQKRRRSEKDEQEQPGEEAEAETEDEQQHDEVVIEMDWQTVHPREEEIADGAEHDGPVPDNRQPQPRPRRNDLCLISKPLKLNITEEDRQRRAERARVIQYNKRLKKLEKQANRGRVGRPPKPKQENGGDGDKEGGQEAGQAQKQKRGPGRPHKEEVKRKAQLELVDLDLDLDDPSRKSPNSEGRSNVGDPGTSRGAGTVASSNSNSNSSSSSCSSTVLGAQKRSGGLVESQAGLSASSNVNVYWCDRLLVTQLPSTGATSSFSSVLRKNDTQHSLGFRTGGAASAYTPTALCSSSSSSSAVQRIGGAVIDVGTTSASAAGTSNSAPLVSVSTSAIQPVLRVRQLRSGKTFGAPAPPPPPPPQLLPKVITLSDSDGSALYDSCPSSPARPRGGGGASTTGAALVGAPGRGTSPSARPRGLLANEEQRLHPQQDKQNIKQDRAVCEGGEQQRERTTQESKSENRVEAVRLKQNKGWLPEDEFAEGMKKKPLLPAPTAELKGDLLVLQEHIANTQEQRPLGKTLELPLRVCAAATAQEPNKVSVEPSAVWSMQRKWRSKSVERLRAAAQGQEGLGEQTKQKQKETQFGSAAQHALARSQSAAPARAAELSSNFSSSTTADTKKTTSQTSQTKSKPANSTKLNGEAAHLVENKTASTTSSKPIRLGTPKAQGTAPARSGATCVPQHQQRPRRPPPFVPEMGWARQDQYLFVEAPMAEKVKLSLAKCQMKAEFLYSFHEDEEVVLECECRRIYLASTSENMLWISTIGTAFILEEHFRDFSFHSVLLLVGCKETQTLHGYGRLMSPPDDTLKPGFNWGESIFEEKVCQMNMALKWEKHVSPPIPYGDVCVTNRPRKEEGNNGAETDSEDAVSLRPRAIKEWKDGDHLEPETGICLCALIDQRCLLCLPPHFDHGESYKKREQYWFDHWLLEKFHNKEWVLKTGSEVEGARGTQEEYRLVVKDASQELDARSYVVTTDIRPLDLNDRRELRELRCGYCCVRDRNLTGIVQPRKFRRFKIPCSSAGTKEQKPKTLMLWRMEDAEILEAKSVRHMSMRVVEP